MLKIKTHFLLEFIHLISVQSTLYFDEGKDRNGLDRNRLFLSFNYQLTLLEMKAEIRDRILSHDKPVISAIYNDKKSQVSCTVTAFYQIYLLLWSNMNKDCMEINFREK